MSTTAFFLYDIYDAMNKNELTIPVYTNATKAFYTVNYEILLHKLEYFGILGKNDKCGKN